MPLIPYSPPYIAWAGTYFNLEQALSTPSLAINTSSLTVSSINGLPPGGGGSNQTISSFSFASISSLNVSSINGLPPGAGGGASSSNVLVTIQSNPQIIGSNASETLELSVEADPNSWWNGSNYSFKPTVAGYYFLSAQATFNPTIVDDNEIHLGIYANDISVTLSQSIQSGASGNAGNYQTLATSALHYFDSSNTNVSILVFNGTGGNLAVAVGQAFTSFQAFLIGGSAGPPGSNGAPGSNGEAGSTLSSFLTTTISSATISSINGWSPDAQISSLNNLSTIVGKSATVSSFDTASISSATISSINGWSIDSAISSIQIPSAALQNALNIVHFPDTPVSTLTWSNTAPSTLYVPLAPDTSVSYLAPTIPLGAGETGWRYTKTYNLIVPSTSGLTVGATYSIVTVGTTNWVAIGASAATIGVSFTYNGLPITGLLGTCVSTKKISWYSRNDLFGLSLPQSNAPATAFTKANLQNAWFLVHFNADIAQQGTLSLQIDTYAYQGTNTSNAYTGRWAYSFPLQQGFGFTAGAATNIVTSNATPRLRSGFTYLLYAGDTEPTYLSPTATQYLAGASGTFAPSQTITANSLRNPYNIYPDYPHFGMTSCLYTSNALQPTYNGAPYTDPAAVEVASIYLNTNSTSPPSGTGQTVVDFNVLAMGYCGTTSSNIAFNYSNVFV